MLREATSPWEAKNLSRRCSSEHRRVFLFRYILFKWNMPSAFIVSTSRRGSFNLGIRICGELSSGDVIAFRKDGELAKRITDTSQEDIGVIEEFTELMMRK